MHAGVRRIDPEAFYHPAELAKILGVSYRVINAARRAGNLRFTQLGPNVLLQGIHVLRWLQASEPRRSTISGFPSFDVPTIHV